MELVPWNRFLGLLKSLKILALECFVCVCVLGRTGRWTLSGTLIPQQSGIYEFGYSSMNKLRLLSRYLECSVCVREDWEVDAEWVGFLITGGWLVLIPAVLIGLLLGDEAPWRRVGPETM
jgi:hypothetical protein